MSTELERRVASRRAPPQVFRHRAANLPRAIGLTDAHARALVAIFDGKSREAIASLGRPLKTSEALEVLIMAAREGEWTPVEFAYVAYTLGLADGRAGLGGLALGSAMAEVRVG